MAILIMCTFMVKNERMIILHIKCKLEGVL